MNITRASNFRKQIVQREISATKALSIKAAELAFAGLLAGFVADGALAFCEARSDGSKCHPEIVRESLHFLRPHVLNTIAGHVNDPDDHGLLGLDYASDDHFDNCNFDGGTDRINDRYLDAPWGVLPALSPLRQNIGVFTKDYPAVFDAATRWAHVLHAAQDYYSHANWVEMGFTHPSTDLIDRGIGSWRELPSNWGLVRGNVIASQHNLPSGWQMTYPSGGRIPFVTNSAGQQFRLLISGVNTLTLASNTCPAGARIHHDDLNKDNITRPLYSNALVMAKGQTRHEWCRLMHLAKSRNGVAGAAVPIGLMVKPTANPHPGGTACAALPPGRMEVNVRVSHIRVLNDREDDTAGQVNFVLTLFSDNFRRSVRTQTAETRVNSGALVPQGALPAPLKLCVNPTDRVVATLQGWEDDDSSARGELSANDDLLNGVTRALGTAADLSVGLASRQITARSDNTSRQDLEVTFVVSAGLSATCQPQVATQ